MCGDGVSDGHLLLLPLHLILLLLPLHNVDVGVDEGRGPSHLSLHLHRVDALPEVNGGDEGGRRVATVVWSRARPHPPHPGSWT